MSIISSLITSSFAIIKSDTRATYKGKALSELSHKAMKLEKNEKQLLITFCGATNFNGKDTYDHIKSEEDKLFELYDNTEVMGNYLKDKLNPQIKKASETGEIDSSKHVIIHIVSKKDFVENNPFICKVIIDYRKVPIVTCGIFGYDEVKGYQIIWNGSDKAQQVLIDLYPEEGRLFNTKDFAESENDLNENMKKAIAADPDGCGEPIETFSFNRE